MMKKKAIILLVMMFLCPAYADVFKWVDGQGTVHFSDTPHPGAEQLSIPEAQTVAPPVSSVLQRSSHEVKASRRRYTHIALVTPANGATIRNNDGSLDVRVDIEPQLFPGDSLQLIVDDAPLGQPQTNLQFELNGLYRGSHTLAVQIIGVDKQLIERSDPITIFMFRPRLGMRTTGR